MLELFDKVWHAEKGAEKLQFQKLHNWVREKGFPACDFPDSYIELLKESNGGDFMTGEREYQLGSIDETMQTYEDYSFARYMPYALPFAMDGCGNFYIINMRRKDDCIYAVSSGDLEWEMCCKIADNLEECLTQNTLIDELLSGKS